MGDVSPEEEIKSWLVNTACDSFILPHRISGYEIHIFLRRRRYNKFVSYWRRVLWLHLASSLRGWRACTLLLMNETIYLWAEDRLITSFKMNGRLSLCFPLTLDPYLWGSIQHPNKTKTFEWQKSCRHLLHRHGLVTWPHSQRPSQVSLAPPLPALTLRSKMWFFYLHRAEEWQRDSSSQTGSDSKNSGTGSV